MPTVAEIAKEQERQAGVDELNARLGECQNRHVKRRDIDVKRGDEGDLCLGGINRETGELNDLCTICCFYCGE